MAGRPKIWKVLRLLILFSLLGFTQEFEVTDDEWEELSPDIAALHRLRGLSGHMFHERLCDASSHRGINGARVQRSTSRKDMNLNPIGLQEGLQDCDESFTSCVIKIEQEFECFLAAIDKQKTQDWLIRASEVSHHYGQKLLVMTDKEKSTHDQVQQDYSMDPHYSVIVSKDCLHNASCVPETNSYSVVKIFGSVSEDGQTVSGLSGSSLAERLLNSSLDGVPVFTLDGNTTTNFQYNFLRIFMVRGIKAVLQLNQQDHEVYKIMNQRDSVTEYQTPLKPVDHTTQYNHQQIIIMQNDRFVKDAATFLYEKHPKVSSVYVLDNNQKLKLIEGKSVPLSEESRLVLVGHGTRDNSGKMRLAGYNEHEVAKITKETHRIGDKIKTTSVVACEAGSDKEFVENLLKELHETANIKTEVHLRDAVVQVRHTGDKITQKVSTEGLEWRHKDDSKKVVANLDRNGNVIIRNEPGSKGEAIFTDERNLLIINTNPRKRFQVYRDSWPSEPRRFIDQNVYNAYESQDQSSANALEELEALSWALFHEDLPSPTKVAANNVENIEEHYVIGQHFDDDRQIRWINNEEGLRDVLSKCYEVNSGEDIRNIIRHYAKDGETRQTYLKVRDWIYIIDPENLYVYPVGKKLNNNQMGDNTKIQEIKTLIENQLQKENYPDIRKNIIDPNIHPKISEERFVKYAGDIFRGEPSVLPLSTEAWSTTYFTASVIAESARNFRTFPLILTALGMAENRNRYIKNIGLDFFFRKNPMARGQTWIDPSRRGFTGSATPAGSSKLNNHLRPRTHEELRTDLRTVLDKEINQYKSWLQNEVGQQNSLSEILKIAEKYKVAATNTEQPNIITKEYNAFKDRGSEPPASGALGGYNDGQTTSEDIISASMLENSFKLESHFSRLKTVFSEEIFKQAKAKYGDNLAGLRLQEDSARIENGQFICNLVSEGAEPTEFRVKLSPESQRYNEQMLKDIDTAVHDLEVHASGSSHPINKYVEHTGTAVGTMGLLLGFKGAVRAFEQGDVKDGVVGALQTAHGVTAMTTSVIARQALSSETRIAKAASVIMKSPAMKGTMTVIPIVGIGFGIYNLVEDVKRGGPLGYIDAAIDVSMIALDVAELALPEFAPFIMPFNLALSVVRMVIDDIYMSIENELKSLPDNAGVLDKVLAGLRGLGKGILHFAIRVASIFYDWHYEEIEEGHRLVAQISDYHEYYRVIKEQDGTSAIDFSGGAASWNGGGVHFCLADQGESELCMDYFVSSDESMRKQCWPINTQGSQDIILGLGESHQLEYKTLQNKVLMFIPAGTVTVVSGYKAMVNSRYGKYRGNKESNRFFAIQKAEDQHVIEVMLSYYYTLYGEPGDDIFFLGPQRSYVQGSGGKDTYIIPENGGKTIINNYDPSKALDTLHFSVYYSTISVSKSGDSLVLMYEGSHTVTIEGWFLGEAYRHMNMMSGDGVFFEISSTVVSSVRLVATGINKQLKTQGETVDASQPLLNTVTNIFGTRYNDVITGNAKKNLIDGGGGHDRLVGGEGEDIYVVKERQESSVVIDNYARDTKTDLVVIEANLKTFRVRVESHNVVLDASHNNTAFQVTLQNWFRSTADRHLQVVTKDLITFTISDNKADCLQSDPFAKCIKSHSIDYSSSPSPLRVDLQEHEALGSVTEVRGSNFDDDIRGNKDHNILIPGTGNDFIQGRAGEDWYIVTPGQGVKTINNLSPDLVLDVLFLKEKYQHITFTCEGLDIVIWVYGRRDIVLQNWFQSKSYQHLQIKTSDGITAGLSSNISSCGNSVMFLLIVDYRNQKPEPLNCFKYKGKDSSKEFEFCSVEGKVMMMKNAYSLKEMYGSSGFDIMVGSNSDNLLDPHTGGGLMSGGEGKDTYLFKQGRGKIMIDNYAEDQIVDTVLVDMDFLDGSQVVLSSTMEDLNVLIKSKGEQLEFTLLDYKTGLQHQHIEFLTSDGVSFKLKQLNSTGDEPEFDIEAFSVILKQSEGDCRMDLNSKRNLSNVHTVQGCPHQSNDLLGNAQDNVLIGGWKTDVLEGGEGDDTLIGGNGDDTLIGDVGDDTLYGEDGKDTMMGNSGRDVFIPGPGADLVDGGPGRDTVLYRGDHDKGKGVYVNLLTGQGRYADAEGDVLKDVETVIGTIYPDILVAGYESSLLQGSDGNDILVSTGGDYLVGGEGNDIYILAFNQGSVTINNCAKDNATDVLYLSSQIRLKFDYELLSDRAIVTLIGPKQSTVKLELEGWTGDDNECGHLKLVSRGVEVSLDWLLKTCGKKGSN